MKCVEYLLIYKTLSFSVLRFSVSGLIRSRPWPFL